MLALPMLIGLVVSVVIVLIAFAIALGPSIAAIIAGGSAMSGNAGAAPAAMMAGLVGVGGLLVLVGIIAAVIISVIAYAWTYAAAEPMWKGGDPDISGGLSKAMEHLGSLVVAGLIVAVVCGLLGITFIGPIIFLFFCIWVTPYIMQANESGTGAIGASFKLTSANFGPSAMLVLGLIVVGIVGFVINAILGFIPLIGHLIGLAVNALVSAYGILAIMRFYNLLTGAPAPAAAAPPAPTAPTA